MASEWTEPRDAAEELVRRFGIQVRPSNDVERMALAVSIAYLTANWEDDGDGVTEEWVKQLLPAIKPRSKSAECAGILGRLTWHGEGDGFCLWLNGESLHWRIMSKGAFRRIAAAIGVPTSEEP